MIGERCIPLYWQAVESEFLVDSDVLFIMDCCFATAASVTPPNLGPIHRVSPRPSQGGPGLFYTRTECEDVIRRQTLDRHLA